MSNPEHDFEAFIDSRVGRDTYDALPSAMRELTHTAFHYGRQTRPASARLPHGFDAAPTRMDAAKAVTFYGACVDFGHTPDEALTLTVAYVQALRVGTVHIDLPPESDDKGW